MQKNSFKNVATIAFLLFLGLLSSSCSKSFSTSELEMSSEVASIICPERFEVTLDFFNQVMIQNQATNNEFTEDDFYNAMNVDETFKGVAGSYLKSNMYKLYLEFVQDIKYLSSYESNTNLPELVSYIKVEDTENHLRKELVDKYKNKIAVLSNEMQNMGYSCSAPLPTREPVVDKTNETKSPRDQVTSELIASMRKVLAVTYQSCAVLEKRPLVKEDPDMKGITEKCCYPNTRAKERRIANLPQVLATHPYLQKSYAGQCHDLTKKPLIYDFGGRPSFTNGSAGELNFFKNWGGTEVLGYDCSAMVYTVLLGAGFRQIENKRFIASDVIAANSRQFLNTEAKGWSCLKSVQFQGETEDALREGDIASQDGHTVMIYRSGQDPYGIKDLKDCKSIDYKTFDFDIIQSSPEKDGVGVNVYSGKDYLMINSTMRSGFIEYAKNFCERAKNGSKKTIKLSTFSLVRVSTAAECRMPIVRFQNESCVQECI